MFGRDTGEVSLRAQYEDVVGWGWGGLFSFGANSFEGGNRELGRGAREDSFTRRCQLHRAQCTLATRCREAKGDDPPRVQSFRVVDSGIDRVGVVGIVDGRMVLLVGALWGKGERESER